MMEKRINFGISIILFLAIFLIPISSAQLSDSFSGDAEKANERITEAAEKLENNDTRSEYLKQEWYKILNKTSVGKYAGKAGEFLIIYNPVILKIFGVEFGWKINFFLNFFFWIFGYFLIKRLIKIGLLIFYNYDPIKRAKAIKIISPLIRFRWLFALLIIIVIANFKLINMLSSFLIKLIGGLSFIPALAVSILMIVILILIEDLVKSQERSLRVAEMWTSIHEAQKTADEAEKTASSGGREDRDITAAKAYLKKFGETIRKD